MIKQLTFFFFLLFSLCLFSSCTIFGSSEGAKKDLSQEDYYADEEDEIEGEGEEGYDTESEETAESDSNYQDPAMGAEEEINDDNVYYIDEEDEADLIAEGENIEVEQEGAEIGSAEERESAEQGESADVAESSDEGQGFFANEPAPPTEGSNFPSSSPPKKKKISPIKK